MRILIIVGLIFLKIGGVFSQVTNEGVIKKEEQKVIIKQENSDVIEYLEFREVDIKDVLRQLAKQYDLNIVFSESVKGPVTVQLHNITIEEALDVIVTANGYVYTKKGNIYKVTTPEEAEKEVVQTKVFKLSNADASKLKETLKKVLSSQGSIEADTRSNSLIVTDIPSVLAKIEGMISKLDEPTLQVLIEAKFIETSLGTTEKLGIDWSMTASVSGSARPTTLPFEPKGEKKWMKNIFPLAKPPAKDEEGEEEEGEFPSGYSYSFPYISASNFTFGTLDFTQYQAVLNFLKTKTKSRLISSPRVVTMDNKQAEIYIGKTRPIPQFEYNDETGNYQITGFEEKIEGVILTATPQISKVKDGYYIKLKLKPKVTNYVDKVTFGALGFDYPVMSERYADTEVVIKSGQTIVIGGLIETKKTKSIHKIPLLGDIPLLGFFFTHRSIEPNEKSELLIFVTARVIEEKKGGKLLAYKSEITISPPRPFKLKFKKVKLR